MALSASLVKQRRALAKLWLKWRLVFVGVVVLVALISGANYVWSTFAAGQSQARQDAIRAASDAIARAVAKAMDSENRAMAELVAPVQLARLVAQGSPDEVAEAEADLAARRADVLRARILPLGQYKTDYETTPPLSFASIDLLRRSERSDEPVSPEVHLFGEEAEHIALASRIEDPAGALVGHVLFAIDLSVLRETMKGISLGSGYAELQQSIGKGKPLVLARQGRTSDRKGAPALRIPVPETVWRVAYWSEATGAAGGSLPVPFLAAGALALVVLAGAGTLLLRRGKKSAAAGVEAEPGDELTAKLAALGSGGAAPADDLAEPEAESLLVEELDEPPAEPGGLDPVIFRAYDVRGIVGTGLTPEVVRDIGRAIGSEAEERGQQTLVVACDGRESGPALLDALVEGLNATGRDVIDVGRVPTPVLYFATHYLNTGSGVMVTGSHNPAEYNGLKIMLGGDTLFGDDIQGLRERIESGRMTSGEGNRQSFEIVDEYIRRVTEDVPVALGNSYKVVVDCGNGIAGTVAPKLIRALGHDVVELYCEVDGAFPNHHPDPSQPENLADLIHAVAEHEADIGFAFDGDGDRLGVVDPKGNIVWPDRQLMLFAHDVLKRPEYAGAEIVFDVKCTNLLAKVIAKSGGKPVMCKTGHSFLKNELKQRGSPLAGELAGHVFFKDRWYGFDDALYAAARMLEILLATKRKPVEVLSRLPAGVSTHEMRVDMEEGQQTDFMERLLAEPRLEDGKPTLIDGLRVDFEDGWGLVRASNTTPSIVLRFEGKTEESLARIQERFREVLRSVEPGIELPF